MNTFEKLYAVDCNAHTEKKGQFTYLSWPFAVAEMSKVDPKATWEVKRFPMPENIECEVPYLHTPLGYFVEVEATVDGVTRSQIHPVLDHRNNPVAKPNVFQINTSIQRALVKAIALHGLGLYIYSGEDLPLVSTPKDSNISGTKTDDARVQKAFEYFVEMIEKDADETEVAPKIQAAYARLTMDEQVAVNNLLKGVKFEKRQGNTILKAFLDFHPELEEV